MHTESIELTTYGEPVIIDGGLAYEVDINAVPWFERVGWRRLTRPTEVPQAYVYMAPPNDDAETASPLMFDAEVPEDDEVLELALSYHQQGKAWEGEAFGWPAVYTPRHRLPGATKDIPSSFDVGEWSVWAISVTWDNGDEKPPHFIP